MTELEIKYEQLKDAVRKMMAAQQDARKNKTVQQKWAIANKYEADVKALIDPKPTKQTVSQATIDWLAQ